MASFWKQVLAVALGGLFVAGAIFWWMSHQALRLVQAVEQEALERVQRTCASVERGVNTSPCLKLFRSIEADERLARFHAEARRSRQAFTAQVHEDCRRSAEAGDEGRVYMCRRDYSEAAMVAKAAEFSEIEKRLDAAARMPGK
jgi:rubrerythrin